MPNITGDFTHLATNGATSVGSGCFKATQVGSAGNAAYGHPHFTITMNASWSNSIYGRSATVQPPSVVMKFSIKY